MLIATGVLANCGEANDAVLRNPISNSEVICKAPAALSSDEWLGGSVFVAWCIAACKTHGYERTGGADPLISDLDLSPGE